MGGGNRKHCATFVETIGILNREERVLDGGKWCNARREHFVQHLYDVVSVDIAAEVNIRLHLPGARGGSDQHRVCDIHQSRLIYILGSERELPRARLFESNRERHEPECKQSAVARAKQDRRLASLAVRSHRYKDVVDPIAVLIRNDSDAKTKACRGAAIGLLPNCSAVRSAQRENTSRRLATKTWRGNQQISKAVAIKVRVRGGCPAKLALPNAVPQLRTGRSIDNRDLPQFRFAQDQLEPSIARQIYLTTRGNR